MSESPRIKLYGFPTSNFYNKVKLGLLEKGIAFEDVKTGPSRDESFLERSPLGKIPYIECDGHFLFESSVIFEFLEAEYPEPPLFPRDAFAAAHVRELIAIVDLYIDAPARRLFSANHRGDTITDEFKERVRKDVERGLAAFTRLARFAPFVAGADYTYADAAVLATLPLSQEVWAKHFPGEAPLTDSISGYNEYIKMLGERPASKKVERARQAVQRMRAIGERK